MNATTLRPGTRLCLCRSCGDRFSGPSVFDLHRTGPWSSRRCLTPTERPHMERREDGVWMALRAPAAVLAEEIDPDPAAHQGTL